jgi:glycosyltransferase involved in cell wall biosynthesis
MHISVILPALDHNALLERALSSVQATLAGKCEYEVICVLKNRIPIGTTTWPAVIYIPDDANGVYNAMNIGLSAATGEYLYFLGQDDIVLPGLLRTLEEGIRTNADVSLSNVYWGDCLIYKNSRQPKSLVWKNWCHQGVLYKRRAFARNVGFFRTEYRSQADHHANILMSTSYTCSIRKSELCAAWYAGAGFSTKYRDLEFREDFPGLVRRAFGTRAWLVVKCRRYMLNILTISRRAK